MRGSEIKQGASIRIELGLDPRDRAGNRLSLLLEGPDFRPALCLQGFDHPRTITLDIIDLEKEIAEPASAEPSGDHVQRGLLLAHHENCLVVSEDVRNDIDDHLGLPGTWRAVHDDTLLPRAIHTARSCDASVSVTR